MVAPNAGLKVNGNLTVSVPNQNLSNTTFTGVYAERFGAINVGGNLAITSTMKMDPKYIPGEASEAFGLYSEGGIIKVAGDAKVALDFDYTPHNVVDGEEINVVGIYNEIDTDHDDPDQASWVGSVVIGGNVDSSVRVKGDVSLVASLLAGGGHPDLLLTSLGNKNANLNFHTFHEGQGRAYGVYFDDNIAGDGTSLNGSTVNISVTSTTSSGPVTAFSAKGGVTSGDKFSETVFRINSDQLKITSNASNADARAIEFTGGKLVIGNDDSSVIDISAFSEKDKSEAVFLDGEASLLHIRGNSTLTGDINLNAGTLVLSGESTIKGNLYLNTGSTLYVGVGGEGYEIKIPSNLPGNRPIKAYLEGGSGSLLIEGGASAIKEAGGKIIITESSSYITNFNDAVLSNGELNPLYLTQFKFEDHSFFILNDKSLDIEDLDTFRQLMGNYTGRVIPGFLGSVTCDENLVVDSGSGSLSVGNVSLTNSATSVEVKQNESLLITGSGDLINAESGDVDITVTNGSLNVGGKDSNGGLISGNIVATSGASVLFDGKDSSTIKNYSVSGNVSLNDNSEMAVHGNAQLQTQNLTVGKDSTVRVGLSTASGVGHLVVNGTLDLQGKFFTDPTWENRTPSKGIVKELKLTNGGSFIVGQNSVGTIGANTDLASAQLASSGHTLAQGDVTAALYITSPVDVAQGSLVVDGSLTQVPASTTDGTVNVASNGWLGIALSDTTATGKEQVFSNGSLVLADNSYLYLNTDAVTTNENLNVILADEVKQDGTVNIKGSSGLWFGYKLTDNILSAQYDPTSVLLASGLTAPEVTRELLLTSKDTAATATLRSMISDGNYAGAAAYMNRFASFANAGAAQVMAFNAVNLVNDAVEEHGSVLAAYAHERKGLDLWIDVNGFFSKATKYESGRTNYGYRADLAGTTFGADYSFGNNVAAGAAVSIGKGNSRGRGVGSGVKNRFEYWGVNLYSVWSTPYVNLIGNAGYLQSKNKIEGHGLKGKPDVNTFSVGIKAEKSFAVTDNFAVTPHIGVRYMNIDMKRFKTGGFSYSADKGNLVQFPVGVAFNSETKTAGGVKIKPVLDLEIAPTAGDRKVKTKFGLVGTGATDTLDTRVANNALYSAKFSVQANKGGHTFGLGYRFSGGNDGRVDQTLQAKYRYSF